MDDATEPSLRGGLHGDLSAFEPAIGKMVDKKDFIQLVVGKCAA
jgi:hypothetical protein